MESQNNQVTSKIIKDLIADHKVINGKVIKLYHEYLGNVEIKNRRFEDPNKVDSKLNNDYRGDIITMITGYLFGEKVSYFFDKDKYARDYQKIADKLNSFISRNNIDDLDSTTGEMMSICGYAARLLYVDEEGQERVMDIKPWEVIFVADSSTDEIQYAMIYYDVELIEGDTKKKRIRVEWYDNKYIYYFISNDKDEYIPDDTHLTNPQPHLFDFVPVVKFINNNAEKGDFEKVNELIDAYDRMLSDIQNEIEEFRIAYFAFYGVEPTPDVMRQARKTGALRFPEGTDAKFLTKPLDDAVQFIENHKKTLNDNIYKFSGSVDMRDEQFSGSAMSGESRKWKLVALENRAKTKERKFVKALRYQFKILFSAWVKKEVKINYEDIQFQFKRNLPIDLEYQSNTTQKFKGMISEKTRLSLLTFIEDPEEEMVAMQKEQDDLINFDDQVAAGSNGS
jgi:SPP1 family phage portal protein